MPQRVTPPPGCERVQYRSSVITLFTLYAIAFVEEIAIIAVALRGKLTPRSNADDSLDTVDCWLQLGVLCAGSIFDWHKRRLVRPLLYLRLVSVVMETGVLGPCTASVMRRCVPAHCAALCLLHPPTGRMMCLLICSVDHYNRAAGQTLHRWHL